MSIAEPTPRSFGNRDVSPVVLIVILGFAAAGAYYFLNQQGDLDCQAEAARIMGASGYCESSYRATMDASEYAVMMMHKRDSLSLEAGKRDQAAFLAAQRRSRPTVGAVTEASSTEYDLSKLPPDQAVLLCIDIGKQNAAMDSRNSRSATVVRMDDRVIEETCKVRWDPERAGARAVVQSGMDAAAAIKGLIKP